MSPEPFGRTEPFWSYEDVALFAGLAIPTFLLSLGLMRMSSHLAAKFGITKELTGLILQFVWYGLLFGALGWLFRLRYRRPFWRSLGWVASKGTPIAFAAGPLLAVATGVIGFLLKAPRIELEPLKGLVGTRTSISLLILFAGFLGPMFEELAFRGFLMPLLIRSMGAALGILITALLFALLHGPEYEWSWRHVVLILLAGAVFGWVRYSTGSTLASTMMHCAYNLTFLAAFVSQTKAIPNKW